MYENSYFLVLPSRMIDHELKQYESQQTHGNLVHQKEIEVELSDDSIKCVYIFLDLDKLFLKQV